MSGSEALAGGVWRSATALLEPRNLYGVPGILEGILVREIRLGMWKVGRMLPAVRVSHARIVACAVLLLVRPVLAQSDPQPLLRGMVVDSTRAPLVSALVIGVDTARDTVFMLHTDSAGEYTFRGLSAGVPYRIIVRKPGFVAMAGYITLRPADTLDFHVMLAAGIPAAVAARSVPAVLRGTVVDSTHAPLAAILVTVMNVTTGKVVSEGRTDGAGRFTFERLAPEVPYRISARRVGFREDLARVTPGPGDTLTVKLVLVPVARLAPVRITSRKDREYHSIDADEIAGGTRPVYDAYDVILWLRPFMLGDPYKGCMTDTSAFTFGPPRTGLSGPERIWYISRKTTLGIGPLAVAIFKNGERMVFGKSPGAQSVDALPDPNRAYPFRLYINGIRRDGPPGVKNILSQIPIEDIQEMHYVDCLDSKTPQYRNALMIVLKPGKSY